MESQLQKLKNELTTKINSQITLIEQIKKRLETQNYPEKKQDIKNLLHLCREWRNGATYNETFIKKSMNHEKASDSGLTFILTHSDNSSFSIKDTQNNEYTIDSNTTLLKDKKQDDNTYFVMHKIGHIPASIQCPKTYKLHHVVIENRLAARLINEDFKNSPLKRKGIRLLRELSRKMK